MTAMPPSCPRCGYHLTATPPPPPPLPRYPAPSPPQREPRRTALAAASVPRILLGLGAGCVLVAAVIFLAVAWSWLGIGGRTGVLVTLTVASAALGEWLARRDLRVAAEALTAVALGLLTLDLVGARDAGWVPLRPDVLVGAALLVASLALRRRLTAQLVAPAGLAVLAVGLADATGQVETAALGVVLACAALAWTGRRLVLLPWSAATVGATAWVVLLGWAGVQALDHLSLRGLWLEGHGWWLLIGAALPLAHRYGWPVAAVLLTGLAVLPVADEGATAVAVTGAALLAVWGVVARRWDGAWVPAGVAALVVLPHALVAVGQAFGALTGGTVQPTTHPLVLPLIAVAAVVAAPWRWRAATAALWLSSVLAAVLLATVPSLLLVLVEPVSPRAVALGLACLVLVLGGTALQWSAPVVVGAVVGGLLVLRELAPFAVQTPQWVLIGAAGILLIGVGVTWEARLRDLRAASGYLGRLR